MDNFIDVLFGIVVQLFILHHAIGAATLSADDAFLDANALSIASPACPDLCSDVLQLLGVGSNREVYLSP